MDAKTLWEQSKLEGEYEAWAFGEAADKLADLVLKGIKKATSSVYIVYKIENEPIPKEGEYSVILNSKGDAVCIIKTTKVNILKYKDVPASFAAKEGEGDLSLEYWREVHKNFFTGELASVGLKFDENIEVVAEEFELVYRP
jgi:uncharacterized protein YhfF